jgi:hypothetical protein
MSDGSSEIGGHVLYLDNGKTTTGQRVMTAYEAPPSLTRLTAAEIERVRRMYDAIPKVTRDQNGKLLAIPHASKARVSEQFIVESAGVEKAMRGELIRPGQRSIILERVANWEEGNPIVQARRSLKTRKRR